MYLCVISAVSSHDGWVFYNPSVKTWDVIIVGGGIIGMSLALELKKQGAGMLVVEKGELGHEASRAAAGMLAASEVKEPLRELAQASLKMYPEFVHELQDESGVNCDLRETGTFVLEPHGPGIAKTRLICDLEPAIRVGDYSDTFIEEGSVDPRGLSEAAAKALKHRSVDVVTGTAATAVIIDGGKCVGLETNKTKYLGVAVVNCAGAWASQLPPRPFPTRPVKGQMLAIVGFRKEIIRRVIRTPDVYLVPRTDGRMLIGATLEEAGYDKRVDPGTIQRLHDAAVKLLPPLADGQIHEAWTGLRPGTPDGLPILGATEISGYFAATGHFRDGILLAPATARVMAQVVLGKTPDYSLEHFRSDRFR